MAVEIEFINLILLKTSVDEKVPGGLAALLERYGDGKGGLRGYWVDEYLLCTGAMNYQDINDEVAFWERHGLKDKDDYVVVEGMFMKGMELCSWLELDSTGYFARRRQTETGDLIRWDSSVIPPDGLDLDWPLEWDLELTAPQDPR